MREIKFRAWDKNLHKFRYPDLWDNSMPSNWRDWYELMQFTGLLDKNGKEIYEGDIVECVAIDGYEDDTRITDVIRNVSGEWQARNPPDIDVVYEHGLPITWGGWESKEVIGNIYENPEMINA